MIKNLKDLYSLLQGGKTFEDLITDYFPEFEVERICNAAYVDQDFLDFWDEVDVEILSLGGKLIAKDDNAYFVFHQGDYILFAKCEDVPNRFDEDYVDETIVYFDSIQFWEKVNIKKEVKDKYLWKIIEEIHEMEDYTLLKGNNEGEYLTWCLTSCEFYRDSLKSVIEYCIEYCEDMIDGDGEEISTSIEAEYLEYLLKYKENYKEVC